MRILNATTRQTVCDHARQARSWWARTRGLLGRPPLVEGEGLLIERCNGVHMFGMRYSIDVVFLGPGDEVIALREGLRPWRMTRLYSGARRALELPAGAVRRTGIEVGHRLVVKEEEPDPVAPDAEAAAPPFRSSE